VHCPTFEWEPTLVTRYTPGGEASGALVDDAAGDAEGSSAAVGGDTAVATAESGTTEQALGLTAGGAATSSGLISEVAEPQAARSGNRNAPIRWRRGVHMAVGMIVDRSRALARAAG
jgi:hypothetical protein